MEELEKHGTPCTEHGVSYAHRCLCRRTRYKCNDDAHAHKFLCRHMACSGCGSARARIFACRHNPCSNRAVGCVSRCQSHRSPCNGCAGARARTSSFFWSCLTASRRTARGRESPRLRRRWRYFGDVDCQRSGWCGCDTRERRTRSGLTRSGSRGENVTVVAVSCNRFFASPPAGVGLGG